MSSQQDFYTFTQGSVLAAGFAEISRTPIPDDVQQLGEKSVPLSWLSSRGN